MDPYNRKFVWEMIASRTSGRTPLLTTHSMEEADALGSTIAIMSHGQLVALGNSVHLKKRFGLGYGIRLVTEAPMVEQLKADVIRLLPQATYHHCMDCPS